jgi:cell division septal protein FtsQ
MQRKKTKERIREVKQVIWQRRKKKAGIILAAVAVVIVLYGAANLKTFLTSFFWDIKTFRVKEVRIIPEKARPLITGHLEIEKGKNLLFLNVDELRKRIMSIREVEDCTIRKIYPSTIEINIILRKPWLALEKEGYTLFVDRNGKILPPPDNPEDFLRVQGVSANRNNVETQDTWKLEVLKEIGKWYNFYNLQKYFSLDSIMILKPTEIVLNDTASSQRIIVMSGGISDRFGELKTILNECSKNKTKWEYIDLRFQHPYVKHSQ